MGLFKLSDTQKAAGINMSTPFNERNDLVARYLNKKKDSGIELSPKEEKELASATAMVNAVAQIGAQQETRSNTITKSSTSAMHCPKCKSTNVQLLGQDREAFSIGKAVGGGLLTGGIGTLAGFAGKKGKYQWVCMDCSNRFAIK